MIPDPIVEEIRKIREAHAARFDYDLARICADLREFEKQLDQPTVSGKPKLRPKDTER